MSIAIKAEHLSKAYQLGQIGTGTISRDIERWWITKVRKKEDPFLKIGEANDRSKKGQSDVVWSLKDINFEIEQGDAVGIIGRNGAGKSTLLKILSEVTSPTLGKVNIKGRIASLLEVGTGFHPELTGRENIFLNGAILGMRKKEIQRKFDEIIDFSGVERYVDTPVKRYSSGMYVRLAFAVAAHLESEVLIIDEVLAVGDAEFQKKCLGKMGEVSKGEGRTVLFVSHNLSAIKNLCNKTIVLKNGLLNFDGLTDKGIHEYLSQSTIKGSNFYSAKNKSLATLIERIEIVNTQLKLTGEFSFNQEIIIRSTLRIEAKHINAFFGFKVFDHMERPVFTNEIKLSQHIKESGLMVFETMIPASTLMPDTYKIQFAIHYPNMEVIEVLSNIVEFVVLETGSPSQIYHGVDNGSVYINCNWKRIN